MRRSTLLLPLAACAAIILGGCSASQWAAAPGPVTQPTLEAAHARWPEATMASLEEGRQLFLASCNRCHSYPNLMSESEEKWPGIVEEMGKKAKLSDVQRGILTRYVVSAHAGGGG